MDVLVSGIDNVDYFKTQMKEITDITARMDEIMTTWRIFPPKNDEVMRTRERFRIQIEKTRPVMEKVRLLTIRAARTCSELCDEPKLCEENAHLYNRILNSNRKNFEELIFAQNTRIMFEMAFVKIKVIMDIMNEFKFIY